MFAMKISTVLVENVTHFEYKIFFMIFFLYMKQKLLKKIERYSSEISRDECDSVIRSLNSLQWDQCLHEDVIKTVTAMVEAEMPDSSMLNQLSWQIYEAAVEDKEFPKEVVAAATTAAEKAVESDPENGTILDTLAHLLHLQGDLDRAIELQTKAVDNAGDAPESAVEEMSAFLKKLKKEKAAQ
jgi:tetratricopeptide (TPR) repeat protein